MGIGLRGMLTRQLLDRLIPQSVVCGEHAEQQVIVWIAAAGGVEVPMSGVIEEIKERRGLRRRRNDRRLLSAARLHLPPVGAPALEIAFRRPDAGTKGPTPCGFTITFKDRDGVDGTWRAAPSEGGTRIFKHLAARPDHGRPAGALAPHRFGGHAKPCEHGAGGKRPAWGPPPNKGGANPGGGGRPARGRRGGGGAAAPRRWWGAR